MDPGTLWEVDLSYSGHSGGAGVTGRGPQAESGVRAFSLGRSLLLVGVIVGWGLFALAAFTNPGVLDDIWAWVGDLPMAGQIVAWTVGLPWMLGIVIFQQDTWTDLARFSSIAAVAIVSFITFLPPRS